MFSISRPSLALLNLSFHLLQISAPDIPLGLLRSCRACVYERLLIERSQSKSKQGTEKRSNLPRGYGNTFAQCDDIVTDFVDGRGFQLAGTIESTHTQPDEKRDNGLAWLEAKLSARYDRPLPKATTCSLPSFESFERQTCHSRIALQNNLYAFTPSNISAKYCLLLNQDFLDNLGLNESQTSNKSSPSSESDILV